MIDQTQANAGFIPFGAGAGGVSPQGFDFGQFAQQIAGQAAQALPGLIMGLLSANPVVGQQLRAQSVAPQGFDLGQFAQQIAGQAAQALPGLITGLLAAHPVVGQQVRAQSAVPRAAAPQEISPQGFDFGQFAQQIAGQAAQALPGLIMGLLSANPMIVQQARPQSFAPQSAAPSSFMTPQGFDFGQLAQQIAGQAAHVLPGLLMGLLSANPVVGPQLRAQSAAAPGVSPQSLLNLGVNTPFGGGGISLFGSAPTAGVTPQGFDFGQLAQQIAGQVATTLPSVIMSILSSRPMVGSAAVLQTMH